MVVVGEVKLGEGGRPRRSLRQILDAAAESVSQPPEPAAADGLAWIRLLADIGKHVEQRKRVGRRVGDGNGTRADDRTPPAQSPVSANGNGSSASASNTSCGVSLHVSGTRWSFAAAAIALIGLVRSDAHPRLDGAIGELTR